MFTKTCRGCGRTFRPVEDRYFWKEVDACSPGCKFHKFWTQRVRRCSICKTPHYHPDRSVKFCREECGRRQNMNRHLRQYRVQLKRRSLNALSFGDFCNIWWSDQLYSLIYRLEKHPEILRDPDRTKEILGHGPRLFDRAARLAREEEKRR